MRLKHELFPTDSLSGHTSPLRSRSTIARRFQYLRFTVLILQASLIAIVFTNHLDIRGGTIPTEVTAFLISAAVIPFLEPQPQSQSRQGLGRRSSSSALLGTGDSCACCPHCVTSDTLEWAHNFYKVAYFHWGVEHVSPLSHQLTPVLAQIIS